VGIGQPADLMTRFLARVIDHVLLFIVQAIIVTTIVFGVIFSTATGGFGGMGGGFGFPGILSSVLAAAIYIGYFAYLESSRGQTLGKMLMKIQVQGPDGQHPSLEVAVKRNAWLALTIVPFLGWLLQLIATIYIAVTINNNTATRQGWHDEFAGGTKVIKIG
jgi:uncharacterized RDD family membrane protein YckC